MPDSMRLRLTDDRELLFERLHEMIDGLPPERYKADIVDMALMNLVDTIENHRSFDGDPRVAKAFRTEVVRPIYRTDVEIRRP